MRQKCPFGTYHGQVRAIVAAKSRAAAARLFDIPDSHLKNYGSETGNDYEISTAMAKPGVVFLGRMDEAPKDYIEEKA